MELEGCGSIVALLFIVGSWLFQAIASNKKKREQSGESYSGSAPQDPREAEETAFDTLQRQLREIGMELAPPTEHPAPPPPPPRSTPPPPPPPARATRPTLADRPARLERGRPGHGGHEHPPLHKAVPGSLATSARPSLLDAATALLDAPEDPALEKARRRAPPSAAEIGDRVTDPLPKGSSHLFSTLRPPGEGLRRPSVMARAVLRDLQGGPTSLARAVLLKEILGPPVALQPDRDLPS